jgi:hypothetical protein
MTTAPNQRDHLSDYERAVCYYTLPRTAHPLTMGLIVAYAVCLLEAVGAIGVGVYLERPAWLQLGSIAFVGLILFGIVAFTLRAFLSELRARRALAATEGVPDARESAQDFPDPFAHHILLHHPSHTRGTVFNLTDDHASGRYVVEVAPSHAGWRIREMDSGQEIRVGVEKGGRSFRFGGVLPALARVYRDGEEVAQLRRPFTLSDLEVEIQSTRPSGTTLQLRNKGFFVDNRLVGRVYNRRGSCYLDIEQAYFNEGVLAYFVTMT